ICQGHAKNRKNWCVSGKIVWHLDAVQNPGFIKTILFLDQYQTAFGTVSIGSDQSGPESVAQPADNCITSEDTETMETGSPGIVFLTGSVIRYRILHFQIDKFLITIHMGGNIKTS